MPRQKGLKVFISHHHEEKRLAKVWQTPISNMTSDAVAASRRYTATAPGAGAAIKTPIAHFFTRLRNGKVAKWEGYSDSAQVAQARTRGKAAAGR